MQKYDSILKRWELFCRQKDERINAPTLNLMLEFLMHLYDQGWRYSGICLARSALSSAYTLKGQDILAQHPFISRFVKGIFNLHRPTAEYSNIWDKSTVLDYNAKIRQNKELTLIELTMKFVMLLMILGGRGKQAIVAIEIENVKITEDRLYLLPNKTLKHLKSGKPLECISYKRFMENTKLCVVHCAEEYLKQRKLLVNENTHKLHKEASSDTVGRWIKHELSNAGIDVNVYKAHSCRAAAASKAKAIEAPLNEILKLGCWKRSSTFTKYHPKDIIGANVPTGEIELSGIILENYGYNQDL